MTKKADKLFIFVIKLSDMHHLS